MRALILDGHGEVGRATAARLEALGVTAVLGGRDPGRYEQMLDLRGDLADLYSAASQATVVVNASGVEDPRLAVRATAAGAAFVEVSTTPSYLSALATAVGDKTPVLAGARLVPVLAGLLAAEVAAQADGPVEVGVVIGAGDPEGAVDIGSTYSLLGTWFPDPATGDEVRNFGGSRSFTLPDGSRRRLTRVNFPDQHMLTAGIGRPVRTWFATSDRFTTTLLRGLARVRPARNLPSAFHLPGADTWQIIARSEGPAASGAVSWAAGRHQTRATAQLVALAAHRAPNLTPGLHRVQDVLTGPDLAGIEGLTLGRRTAATSA